VVVKARDVDIAGRRLIRVSLDELKVKVKSASCRVITWMQYQLAQEKENMG